MSRIRSATPTPFSNPRPNARRFGQVLILPVLWGSMIAGLVIAIVTIFKKTWAPVTTPINAAVEGLLLGTMGRASP